MILNSHQTAFLRNLPDDSKWYQPAAIKRDGKYINWGNVPWSLWRAGLLDREPCNSITPHLGYRYRRKINC